MSYHPVVKSLRDELLWEVNDLEMAVQNALKYDIPELEKYGITSAKGFLDFANWLIQGWIPTETTKGRDIYYIICIFYFVLAQEPLGSRQTPIHPNSVRKPLTPLSEWVVRFAKAVGSHLSEPSSIQQASLLTFWNAPTFRLYEAKVPPVTYSKNPENPGKPDNPCGWKSFNEFFCRELQDGARPIEGKDDDRIVTFPADSTFAGAYQINDNSEVVLKGLPWKVEDLIGKDYAREFQGGVWMHCFLNTFDYHRQHAPVSGNVLDIDVIHGAAYLEVVVKKDEKEGHNYLEPCRLIRDRHQVERKQAEGGIHTVDAPDTPGYQFLQTRGRIIIDNEQLGKVAVLPIGMAQVSSVVVREDLKNKPVTKGDEISHFEFGGSDCVMLFQQKARVSNFPDSKAKTHFFYGQKLAVAHPYNATTTFR